MKQLLKDIAERLLSTAPRSLPIGMTAFNTMASRVHRLTGSICTLDDAKFVITATIMRFDPTTVRKSDRFFVNTLRAAASKQIAGAVFSEVKTRQAEAAAKLQAEAVQKQAEATASQESAASDGETKTT